MQVDILKCMHRKSERTYQLISNVADRLFHAYLLRLRRSREGVSRKTLKLEVNTELKASARPSFFLDSYLGPLVGAHVSLTNR